MSNLNMYFNIKCKASEKNWTQKTKKKLCRVPSVPSVILLALGKD